ncbi:ABC1 kinase family protein [Nocardioides ganghwensis]|jgi:ubiquinone biosynthesis protein|uniref:AarF/ABC1/UbiB kinase family protein n=1 Tax=Nocardioides ganghwensis TaxID=252230 RepID=A0A4Q2SF82_9ACTN|nr:AarF/UbiB family protein [Nocardioides ganghwensis]MBD3946262.1 AarF/ABC1/UbiB kinase family protein [Nocardioides ganghwensis]RYC03411.1 AarF/ABC1/UbiB kinase family protein [Nocardioides ganghwensis]
MTGLKDNRYVALARLVRRHGHSDLLAGAQLDEFDVDDDAPAGDADRATAFAADLEALGPTFIKLGQLLSTRFDLLPPAYTTALERLQDSVEPLPFAAVREVVEAELGATLKERFSEFTEEPLAAASIGQVHRAVLRNGREVVVKVQRPGVRDVVREDMAVLERLASVADNRTEAGRTFGFGRLLDQFRRSLAGELDYRREARSLVTFGELTAPYDLLVVPQPVPEYSTSRILTMDYVEGRKVTDIGRLGLVDLDVRPIVEQLFSAYLHMILDAGVLHADPHPGNLLLTDDDRLALLDLGMTASVPPRIQNDIIKLLLSISDGDGEETAVVLAAMGHPLDGFDPAAFRDDVSHLVSEALAAGSDVSVGTVLMDLSRLSGHHGLRPPAEMSMVGKALLNLDRATSHLDPGFSPAVAIRTNVSEIFAAGLKVSAGGLIAAAIESKTFMAQLPNRANRIMDSLADGEFRIQVQAIDEERLHTVIQRVANRVTLGIIIAATILGAALVVRVPSEWTVLGYPGLAILFFLFAVCAGVAMAVWVVLTDRKVAHTQRTASSRSAVRLH